MRLFDTQPTPKLKTAAFRNHLVLQPLWNAPSSQRDFDGVPWGRNGGRFFIRSTLRLGTTSARTKWFLEFRLGKPAASFLKRSLGKPNALLGTRRRRIRRFLGGVSRSTTDRFVFEIFDSDTRIPHARVTHCARSPVKNTLHFKRELQNRSWGLKRQYAAPRSNVDPEGRAHTPSKPSRGPPPSLSSCSLPPSTPLGPCGIGHGATTIRERGATSTERCHSWPGRRVSPFAILWRAPPCPASTGSRDNRDVAFVSHTYSCPTFDADYGAPVVEDSMPRVDADAKHSFPPHPQS